MTSRFLVDTTGAVGTTDPALSSKVKQAYSDVTVSGSQLTFSTVGGDSKSVSVTGGAGGSVTAFNGATLNTSTNEVTFSSTTGTSADEVVLDLDPMLTPLESTIGGHTTDISNIRSRVGSNNLNNAISDIENNTGSTTLKGLVDGHTSSIYNLEATATTSFYDATITGTNTLNLISNSGTTSLTLPGGTTTSVDAITFNFTVQTVSGSNKYFLHDSEAGALPIELNSQHKYIFTFPVAHPLKLSLVEDGGARDSTSGVSLGNHELTAGVTYDSSTQLTFVNDAARPTANLYYYCANHANMGGAIIEDNGFNNITSITYDSSVPKLEIERAWHDIYGSSPQSITLSDSFVQAQKDGDNIKLTSITGMETSIGPFSGGGTAASSTTNYPTAMTSNALPSPLVAFGSTQYNLFTDKLYGSDNLGNIGTFGTSNWDIQQWAYDVSDGNVIVTAYDSHTRFIKITLDGNLVWDIGGAGQNGKYILNNNLVYTSAADLIADYNSAQTGYSPSSFAFNKHALFDLAVNNSPAYHAFDKNATSEWVSHSNTYDVTTGNPVSGSTAEPLVTMSSHTQNGYSISASTEYTGREAYYLFNNILTPNSDGWTTNNNTYASGSHNTSANLGADTTGGTTINGEYVILNLPYSRRLTSYFIARQDGYTNGFPKDWNVYGRQTMSSNWELIDQRTGEAPTGYSSGGGSTYSTTVTTTNYQSFALVVNKIDMTGTTSRSNVRVAELKFNCSDALGTGTDVGEYLKIDLGSAITAETLNLKSVAEYKEPRLNMTAISQCGYETFASNMSPLPYTLFNSLTTPSTDSWNSFQNSYNASTGNHAASANLGTDYSSGGATVDGEYVAITLPDKRKLLGYKLTKPDGSTDDGSPKEFKLYARENSTSAWVLLTSETLTTAIGEYVSGDVNTGGTRFPSTGDLTPTTAYQTYALVVEKIFTSGGNNTVILSEFQLFCQPAEVENFKLYGSPDNSIWSEIHHQSTAANITSSGKEFTITNPGSYQYYGLVVIKNGGFHNVSLGEMQLGVAQTVDLTNYYDKTELDPLICKARGSIIHTGGSSGTATLLNEVNMDSTFNIPNSLFNLNNFRGYSTTSYHSWIQFEFNFATPLTSVEYQVALTDANQNPSAVYVSNIMSIAVYEKTLTGFKVVLLVHEPSATSNRNFGFDFVVF